MAWPPAVSDFKAYFTREFGYGKGGDMVGDGDIQRALNEVSPVFNQSLLDGLTSQTAAYLYAAAHFLVMNVQAAGGLSATPRGRGVRDSAELVIISKGVGQVNVVYQVPPEWIQKSAVLLPFFRTNFGQRYIQMVAPQLVGNFGVVPGYDDITVSATDGNPI
jgi:hypothetical protein